MSFMQSYKRLDNLCKDLFHSAIGITTYIEAMEKCPGGAKAVTQWQADYLQLKHYRYIRNRIAHENDANESLLCKKEDARWIDHFYNRIINGQDPLTLYRKKQKATTNKPAAVTNRRSRGFLLALLVLLTITLIVLITENIRN